MIRYSTSSFGFGLLFRLHGSAVFRSIPPALVSTGIYLVLFYTTELYATPYDYRVLQHPYAMGALIAALTFLLAFRANFSYNRYWEAFTAVHQMHSKWLDVGLETASFHLQSDRFAETRPPTFGEHPELKCLERERERTNEVTLHELEDKLNEIVANNSEMDPKKSLRTNVSSLFRRKKNKKTTDAFEAEERNTEAKKSITKVQTPTKVNSNERRNIIPHAAFNIFGKNNKNKAQIDLNSPVSIKTSSTGAALGTNWTEDGRPPPLIREAAHLLSLLSAVALSTLRNDLEQADSPLITYKPGAPWPHVDPDAYGADVRKDWAASRHRTFTYIRYMFGMSRSAADRTLYNAARPFRVMGGVSDAEIEMLQAARGPLAKVSLCFMWLQEFLAREHLNGGLGKVAPPIVSRLFQFSSDGMLGYNQARKVSYIPFPFPHAQITSLFVFIVVILLPVLMLNYVKNMALGITINALTVMCFTGLHEVARELECPFKNAPNDVPLNNFQAQFNEALVTMFAGYHPDAYWEVHSPEMAVATTSDDGGNSTDGGAISDAQLGDTIGSTNEQGAVIVSQTYPASTEEEKTPEQSSP